MSLDATRWAWKLRGVTPTEKLILLSYADRANERHEAYPSWRRLMLDTALSRHTIERRLLSLQQKGFMMKTGERQGRTKQVYVYRLIGVIGRDEEENLSTTSSKSAPLSKLSTRSKIAPCKSSKIAPCTSSKSATQNLKEKHQRKPKGETLIFSDIFNCIKSLKALLSGRGKVVDDDVIDQVMFYVEKSKPQKDAQTSIHMAVHLIIAGRWQIPHGYKGITSKSIREKDEAYERQKEIYQDQDGKNFRLIKNVARIKTDLTMAERMRIFQEELNANNRPMQENHL